MIEKGGQKAAFFNRLTKHDIHPLVDAGLNARPSECLQF
jgi:hypothetical protein